MRYFLYNLLMIVLAPFGAAYLLCSRKHRALLQRFSPPVSVPGKERVVWVHACSVGEVFVAKVLVKALQEAYPETGLLLTVNTQSGFELAGKVLPGIPVSYAPFDLAGAVRRFVGRVQPAVLVILETELWPNLIRETRRAGVPVLIVNGRISPRKYPGYRRYRHVLPPVYSWINEVGVQEEVYRQRFTALGVPDDRTTITGNLKFDGVTMAVESGRKEAMRAENGFDPADRVLVFGSTRPGDEVLAASCWDTLKVAYPDLLLVVAPRHLQRLDEVLAAFANETVVLRSKIGEQGGVGEARILILDTMGELAGMYAIASIAVIGGSFYPGVEGHNPLESAALGVPTVFGPYMGNFPEAATLLCEAGGALRADSPADLTPLLKRLLDDPEYGGRVGARGREAVLRNQGAARRSVALIGRHLT